MITIFTILATASFTAQTGDNCSEVVVVCANQSLFASNESATTDVCAGCEDGQTEDGNFCFALNNTIWLSFQTNNVGGDVNVSFSNLNCNTSSGYNTSIQAAIISATTPCDESTYSLVSNCNSGSNSSFNLNTTSLPANTTFYIQIDGDSITGNTNAAECGFNVLLSGTGVEFNLNAGADTTINFNSAAALSGSGPAGSTWSPTSTVGDPNATNTVANPNSTTTYFYSYTDDNGCVYSDNVTVTVRAQLLVTNTFSPNDDGINDIWTIRSIGNYPSCKVDVFDRWGQRVFHSIGYGNEKVWDGTLAGARLPEGVYYYYIDLNTGNEEDVYAGYVTILK